MASSDFFTYVGNPGTATTLTAPGHTIGGSTFNVISTSNWPTVTGAIFAVDTFTLQTVNGVANVAVRTPGSYTEWEGDVTSSTAITGAVLRYGTDQNYSAGTNTRVYIPVASSRENRLAQGILAGHNQDGTHKAFTESNIIPAAAIQSNAVITAKLNNGAVTPDKLGTGALRAVVATAETTTSTSYADLTTTTDTVTVTIGANALALVSISSSENNSVTNNQCFVSVAVSGTSTVAATDANSFNYQSYTTNSIHQGGVSFLLTAADGLVAGSSVFKMKYRVSGGTGTFSSRKITVLPL